VTVHALLNTRLASRLEAAERLAQQLQRGERVVRDRVSVFFGH
jgi:hypothetical protein